VKFLGIEVRVEVTERIFGVAGQVLGVEETHRLFRDRLIRHMETRKRKPRRGPVKAKSDGGLFVKPGKATLVAPQTGQRTRPERLIFP